MPKREYLGEYELSLDEAVEKAIHVISRDFDKDDKPNLGGLKVVVLKKGKIVTKLAKFWGIRSQHTGEHKFNNLNLLSLRRTQKRGWEFEIEGSITIDDKQEDNSIEKLFNFLASLPQLDSSGDFVVINVKDVDVARFKQILEAVSDSQQKVVLMSQILSWIEDDPRAISGLIQLATDKPMQAKSLVAALNYARLTRVIQTFKQLVDENQKENVYQKFLEENYWIFGSEYSELIPNRNIIKGMQLDFPLRRTVDGYLDIIEIKTPLNGQPLFRKSSSRWSEIADVVDARTQADDYLSSVDAQQYQIYYQDELDVEKVRAKIIIGRSGDAEQTKALRRLNARTNRIEVLTFDQLIKIAQRMLDLLVQENPKLTDDDNLTSLEIHKSEDEIPF